MQSHPNELRKISASLNLMGLIAAVMVSALSIWAGQGLEFQLTYLQFARIISLTILIFFLPDLLAIYSPHGQKWFGSIEFYSIAVLLSLSLLGFLSVRVTYYLQYLLFICASLLLGHKILVSGNRNMLLHAVAYVFFLLFMILLFYSRGYHSVLYTQKIILGIAHIDQLFHSSISNMMHTVGFPTTALDGTPLIHYHWGSHLIMAGLKPFCGIPTLMMYNIVYPAIFIPLFLKAFILFVYRLFRYKESDSFNLLFIIATILSLYATLYILYFHYAQPFLSESNCISFVFAFFYAAIILGYYSHGEKLRISFIAFSIILLFLITLTKVSTGFTLAAAIAYLFMRTKRSKPHYFVFFIGLIALVFFCINIILPSGSMNEAINLPKRLYNIWLLSNGFISYSLGIMVIVITLARNHIIFSTQKLITAFREKEYLGLEFLFVLSVSGMLGGLAVSSVSQDVAYFFSAQFFFALAFILIPLHRYYEAIELKHRWKQAFLLLVIIMLGISRHDVLVYSLYKLKDIQQSSHHLSPDQKVMKSLVDELLRLEKSENREQKCIYIPADQEWYYKSQSLYPYAASFVVPAISGIALINGINEEIRNSGIDAYSFNYYNNGIKIDDVGPKVIAIKAKKQAYKELIIFKKTEGKLSQQRLKL